jgi:ArsR family transcriptional regulator
MKLSNLAKIFKALSSEQRLAIFQMIYLHQKHCGNKTIHNGCCLGMEKSFTHACHCLKISRSTVSHHFKELVGSGLINRAKQGQSNVCSINEEAMKAIKDLFG